MGNHCIDFHFQLWACFVGAVSMFQSPLAKTDKVRMDWLNWLNHEFCAILMKSWIQNLKLIFNLPMHRRCIFAFVLVLAWCHQSLVDLAARVKYGDGHEGPSLLLSFSASLFPSFSFSFSAFFAHFLNLQQQQVKFILLLFSSRLYRAQCAADVWFSLW